MLYVDRKIGTKYFHDSVRAIVAGQRRAGVQGRLHLTFDAVFNQESVLINRAA